jgi:8-oxo-dGTP pyrophosphatase MutT (NUDIX family)
LNAKALQTLLALYLKYFPDERFEILEQQLAQGDTMNNRKTYPGHITGSAFILAPDKTKLLLIKHKIYGDWFQPGGHWDPDESDPLTAARREAEEETAVQIADYLSLDATNPLVPLDIDSHLIPANPNKGEAEHWHHDFRYAFIAANETFTAQELEVDGIGWFALDAPEAIALGKAIGKMRQVGFTS